MFVVNNRTLVSFE